MGQEVAHAIIEQACDEIVLHEDLPVEMAINLVVNFPVQRVEGYRATVLLILSTGNFEIEEFVRCEDVERFGRVGPIVFSLASVNEIGAAIQMVALRRDTFGELSFFRFTNRTPGATLLCVSQRMVVF